MSFDTIVSGERLASHLGNPAWVVFDCRHDLANVDKGERLYRASHIPGARFAHLDRDLSGPKTGSNGRHPLPDPAALAGWLGRMGVDAQKQVVVYDDAGGAYAARLWWLLRWLDHRLVAVLDGGWQAWVGAGHAITAEPPRITPARFEGQPDSTMAVDAAALGSMLGDPNLRLIDARSPDRYRGENETIDPVAGHIPGAVNRFFKDNLDAQGRFKPAAELRAAFESLAASRPSSEVISQCGSGVTACHNLLAMEIAGLPGARLYPGSWSEWCSDPQRPIERG